MTGEPDAVFFHDEDYASIGRRIGAWLLDFAFVFFMMIMLLGTTQSASLHYAAPHDIQERSKSADPVVRQQASKEWQTSEEGKKWSLRGFAAWLVACLLYYVAFRRLRGGTFGYRIVGIRLVDRSGNSPSLVRLAGRFFLASIATLPFGASYLQCWFDPRRQSFHDRWSGTWMVRKRAEPAGPAKTGYGGIVLGTYILNYPVLEPVSANGDDTSTADESED